ncbi:MAG: TlpA disulfide reductase family protein [Acidobacteriota bacterium]|nr:TlpA family protein disulfide reductase [Blastocatellia bacterium]MDW8240267.1 TlpA disulfide reductase family protein [Acidobacteriota bacterium]
MKAALGEQDVARRITLLREFIDRFRAAEPYKRRIAWEWLLDAYVELATRQNEEGNYTKALLTAHQVLQDGDRLSTGDTLDVTPFANDKESLVPRIARARFEAGKALAGLKQYQEAETELLRAEHLMSWMNDDFYLRLAEVAQHLDKERALSYYLKALVARPAKVEEVVRRLKEFYVKVKGTEQGLANLISRTVEEDRVQRRGAVLSQKMTGPQAPDFELTALDGPAIKLSLLRGKVVVLHFWATWCAPCIWELPQIEKLHRQLQTNREVVLLTISVDQSDSTLKEFLSKHGYTFAVLRDKESAVKKAYGLDAIPAILFIDRAGRVRFEVVGSRPHDRFFLEELNWRIEDLLTERNS